MFILSLWPVTPGNRDFMTKQCFFIKISAQNPQYNSVFWQTLIINKTWKKHENPCLLARSQQPESESAANSGHSV